MSVPTRNPLSDLALHHVSHGPVLFFQSLKVLTFDDPQYEVPLSFSAEVPSSLKAIVEDLVGRDPEYRTPTAVALLGQLQKYVQPSPPTDSTVDIDAILKPISRDKPCGVDPRYGSSFELLKEARREEDAASQGEWMREVKSQDWPKAIQMATAILSTEGKDLQVAVWLTEALVRKHGPAGLRDGLKILRGFHEQYWDSLYPPIEDNDMGYRSGRLEALDKILPIAIRNMPLIRTPGGPSYSYWHYKESQEVESLRRVGTTAGEKKRQLDEALEEGKLEPEKFEKAFAATPLSHCSAILEKLNQSWDEFEQFERIVDEQYCSEAPSLWGIKEAIKECRSLMNGIVQAKEGVNSSPESCSLDAVIRETRIGREEWEHDSSRPSPKLSLPSCKSSRPKWWQVWKRPRLSTPFDTLPSQSEAEPVLLGASAPKKVTQGKAFTARFVAYTPDVEKKIGRMLASLAPDSSTHLALKTCRWKWGTDVVVQLSGQYLEVQSPTQTFKWEGKHSLLDFDVTVAANAPPGTTTLKYDVSIHGVIVKQGFD